MAAEENIQGERWDTDKTWKKHYWNLTKAIHQTVISKHNLIHFYLGLQLADVELDARVAALEENSGVGTENGKLNDMFLDVIYNMRVIRGCTK